MSNIWDVIERNVNNKHMALFAYVMSLFGILASAILSVEDWKMSYYGFQWLEQAFGLNITTTVWVLWVLAFVPWLGQIIFFMVYSLDTSKKWPLGAAAGLFLFDLATDVQYRSQANLLQVAAGLDGTTPTVAVANRWVTVGMATGVTMVFFSIMAEVLFTASVALLTTLYVPAIEQWGKIQAARIRANRAKQAAIKNALSGGGGGGGNQQNQRRDNQRRNAAPPVADILDDIPLMPGDDFAGMLGRLPGGPQGQPRRNRDR